MIIEFLQCIWLINSLNHVQYNTLYIFSSDDIDEDCIVCMEEEADVMIVPCGHFYCGNCIIKLNNYGFQCPECRGNMGSYMGLGSHLMFSSI